MDQNEKANEAAKIAAKLIVKGIKADPVKRMKIEIPSHFMGFIKQESDLLELSKEEYLTWLVHQKVSSMILLPHVRKIQAEEIRDAMKN